MFNSDTIYIIGDAQASNNNPITQQFNSFFIGLVIDTTNHKIIDAGCSATILITSDFVKSLFLNQNMFDNETIENEIRLRYFGSSQKALVVAFKDAQKKYKGALQTRGQLQN